MNKDFCHQCEYDNHSLLNKVGLDADKVLLKEALFKSLEL